MDNVIVNQIFPFNEHINIAFQLQLYFKKDKVRKSITFDAVIKLDNTIPLLYLDIDSTRDIEKKEVAVILSRVIKKKDYKIINPKANGSVIKLVIGRDLFFNRTFTLQLNGSQEKKHVCTMELKQLYYSYVATNNGKLYRLSSVSSSLIIPHLSTLFVNEKQQLDVQPIEPSFTFNKKSYTFTRDDQFVYIRTKEDDITDLLTLLSLFFCNPIEYDMVASYEQETCCNVEVKTPKYKTLGAKDNNILQYLFCEDVCFAHYFDFLSIANKYASLSKDSTMYKTYVDNYVRAEYLDDISKLLLYHTIIEKITGVESGEDTYDTICKNLKENYHIDANKINDGIDSQNIVGYNNKEIVNFVQLRNFYVHHLGSEKASEFLRDSDLLFYMKQAITILLLKLLGIKDVKFDKGFHKISVFDNSVEEFDYRKYILDKCKNNM